jgi:nucleotide-binding universal stress UspA family protein
MLDNNSSILVPYDGTELSLKALEKAGELGQKFSCQIIVLYVVDDRSVYPVEIRKFVTKIQDLDNVKEQFVNIMKEAALSMIKEKTDKLKEKGLSVDYIIRIGSPEDEILAVARDQYPDMIVMGSSGTLRQLHEKKGMGSVSRWVSEMVDCPVMLIR